MKSIMEIIAVTYQGCGVTTYKKVVRNKEVYGMVEQQLTGRWLGVVECEHDLIYQEFNCSTQEGAHNLVVRFINKQS